MIKVDADVKAIERAQALLAGVPNGVQRAMVSSFNRALLEGRTAGTREATKRYTLPAGIIRKTMVMHRASKNSLEADLASRGRRVALKYFAHKPKTDTTGAKRREVSVSVRRGALKPLGQGFIYHGKVMQRLGAERLPVQEKYSVSVPNILNNPEIVDGIQDKMVQSVAKRMAHETDRILKEYSK